MGRFSGNIDERVLCILGSHFSWMRGGNEEISGVGRAGAGNGNGQCSWLIQ